MKGLFYKHGANICLSCAEKAGCTWPDKHIATLWLGVCCYCGKQDVVSASGDWNWPELAIRTSDAGGMEP
jgi:hypothetical protein